MTELICIPVLPLPVKKILVSVILYCFCVTGISAQHTSGADVYTLHINLVGKDSSFNMQQSKLKTVFSSETMATDYVSKIPGLLASAGYPAASVDSFWATGTNLHIHLYTGKRYNLVNLDPRGIEPEALSKSGFLEKNLINKPVNINQLQQIQKRLLRYYETHGYPFASVYLDSISIADNNMSALLKADRSVLYHIDSIRVYGKANISKNFLQRYLDIRNGSIYNKERLEQVDKKMTELPYLTSVQVSDLTMLGSGSVLNLYLQPKKSSQVNFLVGFLPAANNTGKLQLTGDVNLDLKNMLGGGESILVKWQQLQVKSPRLNLGFVQPFIFNSAFGLDFLFELFKKDSSFLQINAQGGVQYSLSATGSGKVFLQYQSTSLLSGGVDTNAIKAQKKLPPHIDISSVNVGLQYDWINTNYRFNPRIGNEVSVVTTIGLKKVKQNNEVTGIKDPSFNYSSLYDSVKPESYQLRVKFNGAHYFPVGKFSTIKASLTGGMYMSPDIFRNELFQIGGYRLLRGFDEESIYASRFAVASAEYRVLVNVNSYFFFFADAGIVKNNYQSVNVNNNFIGTGLGLLYEMKLGLLNISFAIGKRDDVNFNLREASKLHFGYINYF